jgi:hypothetical protein
MSFAADPGEMIRRFAEVWNLEDADKRLAILRLCCSGRAEFVSPQGVLVGIEAFNKSITGFYRKFPHATVLFGPPVVHNGYGRVRWRTLFNAGLREPLSGDDYIEFGDRGLIRKVVSFDGSSADA